MQVNSVVFRHAHRLANGQIITHAHPYNLFGKSCPLSPNPHTRHELLLLDAVSNPAFIPTFALLLAFLLLTRRFISQPFFGLLPVRVLRFYRAYLPLRGPPALSSLLA